MPSIRRRRGGGSLPCPRERAREVCRIRSGLSRSSTHRSAHRNQARSAGKASAADPSDRVRGGVSSSDLVPANPLLDRTAHFAMSAPICRSSRREGAVPEIVAILPLYSDMRLLPPRRGWKQAHIAAHGNRITVRLEPERTSWQVYLAAHPFRAQFGRKEGGRYLHCHEHHMLGFVLPPMFFRGVLNALIDDLCGIAAENCFAAGAVQTICQLSHLLTSSAVARV